MTLYSKGISNLVGPSMTDKDPKSYSRLMEIHQNQILGYPSNNTSKEPGFYQHALKSTAPCEMSKVGLLTERLESRKEGSICKQYNDNDSRIKWGIPLNHPCSSILRSDFPLTIQLLGYPDDYGNPPEFHSDLPTPENWAATSCPSYRDPLQVPVKALSDVISIMNCHFLVGSVGHLNFIKCT